MAFIGTRKLTALIDAVEMSTQVSTLEITSSETDSNFVPFADAASGGGRTYKLHVVAAQDASTGTFWDKMWTKVGQDVAVTIKPYSGVASPATPWFTGTVTIVEPNGVMLGGDADGSTTNVFTIDVEWVFTARPVRVTT